MMCKLPHMTCLPLLLPMEVSKLWSVTHKKQKESFDQLISNNDALDNKM